jgi:hypothetical protein
MFARIALLAVVTVASRAALGSILPERLGEYSRGTVSAAPIPAADREVFAECGLRASEASEYRNVAGRRMGVEGFRFIDSEGGHAAYLWLRPPGAVSSPLEESTDVAGVFGETYALVGGGITVVERKNYVFRFRGAVPDQAALDGMLNGLIELDPTEPGPDECCYTFVEGSERILLGPASLARLVPAVPPSVAAFHLGAKGRIARFEMPSGPMLKIVFTYPVATMAIERSDAFSKLPGAFVRVGGKRVGVIFNPADQKEAAELLNDLDYDVPRRGEIGWDPRFDGYGVLMIEGGIGTVFWGAALGLLVGTLGYRARWRNGIPDRLLALRLSEGQTSAPLP